MLSTEIRKTLLIGLAKRLELALYEVNYFNDPKAPKELKHSITYIVNELDDIEETIDEMHEVHFFNHLESLKEKLNQIKETVQMTISHEVV